MGLAWDSISLILTNIHHKQRTFWEFWPCLTGGFNPNMTLRVSKDMGSCEKHYHGFVVLCVALSFMLISLSSDHGLGKCTKASTIFALLRKA